MTRLAYQEAEVKVRHEFVLPADQVLNLQRLAANRHVSENELVSKALDIFLDLTNLFGDENERRGWYRLAEPSLLRVWDNDEDAVYDNWRQLYGVPEG